MANKTKAGWVCLLEKETIASLSALYRSKKHGLFCMFCWRELTVEAQCGQDYLGLHALLEPRASAFCLMMMNLMIFQSPIPYHDKDDKPEIKMIWKEFANI